MISIKEIKNRIKQYFSYSKSTGGVVTHNANTSNQGTCTSNLSSKVKKYKRILDSVHGTIFIESDYMEIINTPYFQRLRRIEQSPIRSAFPSARHDRFIHSLGVFHIGSEVVNHLKDEIKNISVFSGKEQELEIICESYKIACLLHDVGHSPFSHSFEKYFGSTEELCDMLAKSLKSDVFFKETWEKINKEKNNNGQKSLPKPHECVSAILCCHEKLSKYIKRALQLEDEQFKSYLEFIVRMITGIKYNDDTGINSIKNCFIELLHGEVDADRIDYACRDTWAAGYSTTKVDARSLVSCIHIRKNPNKKYAYCVCFEKRAIAEIENMFGVKSFQNLHVFSHHTVVYDQYLLERAVVKMAIKKYGGSEEEAMSRIFNVDALTENYEGEYHFLCDDDIVHLLKVYNNIYYKEWNSHKYNKVELWKSAEEFLHLFPIAKGHLHKIDGFEDDIKNIIDSELSNYNLPNIEEGYERVNVEKINMQSTSSLSGLKILIGNHVEDYDKIDIKYSGDPPNKLCFYYVYVILPHEDMNGKKILPRKFKAEMCSKITQLIETRYAS